MTQNDSNQKWLKVMQTDSNWHRMMQCECRYFVTGFIWLNWLDLSHDPMGLTQKRFKMMQNDTMMQNKQNGFRSIRGGINEELFEGLYIK